MPAAKDDFIRNFFRKRDMMTEIRENPCLNGLNIRKLGFWGLGSPPSPAANSCKRVVATKGCLTTSLHLARLTSLFSSVVETFEYTLSYRSVCCVVFLSC